MSDKTGSTAPAAPAAPAPFHLSLKGDGISVDKDVDLATALQVLSISMGGGSLPIAAAQGTPPARQQVGGTPARSIREKLDGANAKRWPDKIVVIGQHIQDTGKESFTRDEIRKLFPAAGEPGRQLSSGLQLDPEKWLGVSIARLQRRFLCDAKGSGRHQQAVLG